MRESVSFKNHGKVLFGMLHLPEGDGPFPAVLVCHGFGGHKIGKSRMYVETAEELESLGVACLRVDFRGSGESEGEFEEMTLEGEISDVMKSLEFLEEDERIDNGRIGLLGKSLGGMVAVIAARRYEKIKSLALWSAAFQGKQWLERWKIVQDPATPPEVREQLSRFDGFRANEIFLKEFFSVQMEEELRGVEELPMLHVHGEKDDAVTLTHAELYDKARQNASGKTKIIRLPNTDHDYSHTEERERTVEVTAGWFKETL